MFVSLFVYILSVLQTSHEGQIFLWCCQLLVEPAWLWESHLFSRYEIEKELRAVCQLPVFDDFVAQLGSDLYLLFLFVSSVLIVFVFVILFVFVSASNLCAFWILQMPAFTFLICLQLFWSPTCSDCSFWKRSSLSFLIRSKSNKAPFCLSIPLHLL